MAVTSKNLSVALIQAPVIGHNLRGTGIYTTCLFQALNQRDDVSVELISNGSDLSRYDIVHYPYFDPFFLTLPLIKKKPTIVTVHDLIPLRFPRFFPKGIRGNLKWKTQQLSLLGAKALITDSYFSKSDIELYTSFPSHSIHVVPLGVSSDFFQIKEANVKMKIRQKFDLPEQFCLFVGDVNYNKNVPELLIIFHKLLKKLPNLHLVLIGKGFFVDTPELNRILILIDHLEIKARIHRLHELEITDLRGIYNLATIYIQPSLAEGFGLTVLEAMACGCPVIVNNFSSLSEIVTDTNSLVNINNYQEVIEKISKILNYKKIRMEMIRLGMEECKKYTWEKCAEKTSKIYNQVLI